MRHPITIILLACLLSTGMGFGQEEAAADDIARVQVNASTECPIRVLPRKTRVVDPTLLAERGGGFPAAQEMYKRKFFGATERQNVYDVTFSNESDQDLVAVAFAWTAFDKEGKRVYRRMSAFAGSRLSPGEVHTLHDLDVMIPGEPVRYEVSVLKAEFADGSVCLRSTP